MQKFLIEYELENNVPMNEISLKLKDYGQVEKVIQ